MDTKKTLRNIFLSEITKEDIETFFNVSPNDVKSQFVNMDTMRKWMTFLRNHENYLAFLTNDANPLNPPKEFLDFFKQIESGSNPKPVKSDKMAIYFRRLHRLVLIFDRIETEIKCTNDILKTLAELSNKLVKIQTTSPTVAGFLEESDVLCWVLVFCLMEMSCPSASESKESKVESLNQVLQTMTQNMLIQLNTEISNQYLSHVSEKRSFASLKCDFKSFIVFASFLFATKQHKFEINYTVDFYQAFLYFLVQENKSLNLIVSKLKPPPPGKPWVKIDKGEVFYCYK